MVIMSKAHNVALHCATVCHEPLRDQVAATAIRRPKDVSLMHGHLFSAKRPSVLVPDVASPRLSVDRVNDSCACSHLLSMDSRFSLRVHDAAMFSIPVSRSPGYAIALRHVCKSCSGSLLLYRCSSKLCDLAPSAAVPLRLSMILNISSHYVQYIHASVL